MKQKILSILCTAMIFLFAISMISAITFSQSVDTIDYTSNLANPITGVTFDPTSITEGSYNYAIPAADFSADPIVNFDADPNYDNLKTGKIYSTTSTIADGTSTEEVTLEVLKSFCSLGSQNDTDLQFSVDVDNNGEGEDDDWTLRDRVEVEVDFDNDKDVELEDVMIEFGLFDADGDNVADDLDWKSTDDEEADVNDIEDGDNVKHTFEFIVPNDIEDGNYLLMIKVYSDDDGEDVTCIDVDDSGDYYQNVAISRESDDEKQIKLESINLDSTQPVPCGTEVTLTAKAYNVGSAEDQEAIKFNLYNKDLGIDVNQVVENVDADESANVELTFTIPEDAEEKSYTLNLWSQYDYDEDDDEDDDEINFDDDSFGEESETEKVYVNVDGMCKGSIEDVEVTAALSEDTPKAKVGKEVVIEVTLENTGDTDATYKVTVDNAEWAETKISPSSVTLGAGETETVQVTLDINRDTEAGEQEFTLKTTFGEDSKEQTILVEVEESSLFGGSIIDHLRSNAFIYIVILVDIILIVAIIIAVTRMVKKPSA
jgi:uncharacterized membrane protein